MCQSPRDTWFEKLVSNFVVDFVCHGFFPLGCRSWTDNGDDLRQRRQVRDLALEALRIRTLSVLENQHCELVRRSELTSLDDRAHLRVRHHSCESTCAR